MRLNRGAILILALALAAAPWRSSEGAPQVSVGIGAGVAGGVAAGVAASAAALGAATVGAGIAASLVGIGRRGTPKKKTVYQYVYHDTKDVPNPYPSYPPYRGPYYHPFQGRYGPGYSYGGWYGHAYHGPGYGENGHSQGYTSQQAKAIREGPQSARTTYEGEKLLTHECRDISIKSVLHCSRPQRCRCPSPPQSGLP